MSFTKNLNLFKHDNPEENEDLFDITKSLNENWDKIDEYVYEKEASRQENEETRKANEEERKNKETERKQAESDRKLEEQKRKNAEEERKVNEEQRICNEEAREEYISELKQKVKDGEFKGDPNILSIGTVETGEEAFAEITGNSPTQTLNLVLPKGDKGEQGKQGETGKGIQNIVLKEGSHIAGQFDTYEITFTDGTTTEFQVYNGQNGDNSFTGNYEDLINKPIYYWDGKSSNDNPNNIELWQKIYDTVRTSQSANSKSALVLSKYERTSRNIYSALFCIGYSDLSTTKINLYSLSDTYFDIDATFNEDGIHITCENYTTEISISDKKIISVGKLEKNEFTDEIVILPTNSEIVKDYTPTYDYHPATKKYVDDIVGNISAVLDNINGEVV